MRNKRKSIRYATLSPCLVRALSNWRAYESQRIINHSREGVLLELDAPIPVGEYMDIRFSHDAQVNSGFWMTSCIGQVRWCRKQDSSFGGKYGVGLAFMTALLLRRV